VRVFMFIGVIDKVARCKVENHIQFNGEYGCAICKQPGKKLHDVDPILYYRNNSRVYPFNDLEPDGPVRTRDSILECTLEAIRTNKRIKGVFGPRAFFRFKHFNIVHGYVIESIHGVYLGVLRRMYKLWFNGSTNNNWYIGAYINDISSLYRKNVFYPSGIGRTVHNDKDEAQTLLILFVKKYEKLYSVKEMVSAVHDMLHLAMHVKMYNALHGWSGFGFESLNGLLVDSVHDNTVVHCNCLICHNGQWLISGTKFRSDPTKNSLVLAGYKYTLPSLLGVGHFDDEILQWTLTSFKERLSLKDYKSMYKQLKKKNMKLKAKLKTFKDLYEQRNDRFIIFFLAPPPVECFCWWKNVNDLINETKGIPLQPELLRKCRQKTPSNTARHIIQAIYPDIVEQANIKASEIQDLCKSIISRQKLGAKSSINSLESNNAVFAIDAQDDNELEHDQQQVVGDDTSNIFDDFSVN
ncbi:unnamed protein product, partial [Didymodactylos carnosus]